MLYELKCDAFRDGEEIRDIKTFSEGLNIIRQVKS